MKIVKHKRIKKSKNNSQVFLSHSDNKITREERIMKENARIINEICKDAVSSIVEKGFLESNLSAEQLKKLNEIKEKNKKAD